MEWWEFCRSFFLESVGRPILYGSFSNLLLLQYLYSETFIVIAICYYDGCFCA